MRESLEAYCRRTNMEYLLQEWDYARNGGLTPSNVSYGSHRKFWWQCGKGHSWQAQVTTRTNNHSGCPYCAGVRPYPGETDLAACYPEVAAQWHPTKNGALTPDQVLPGSHRMVWWICPEGHEWKAVIKSRVSGCGCPVCANRVNQPGENDLASLYPDVAAQWHPTKNGTLTPKDVVAGSHLRVWWRCEQGHEWRAQIYSRTKGGVGCPFCAGRRVVVGVNDLETLAPEIAAQWNYEKNGLLDPTELTQYSNRIVWWRCEKGHEWKAPVSARTERLIGCPYCAGRRVLAGFNDLATVHPEIAAQWYQPLNGTLTPQMVTSGSKKKVWWECAYGHVWKAVISSRTGRRKCGCPICAGRVKSAHNINLPLKPEPFGRNTGAANCSVLGPAGREKPQTNPPPAACPPKRRAGNGQETKVN